MNDNIPNKEVKYSGDEKARALAENTNIINLNLWMNNIGGEGVRALAENKTITNLIFWGNNIGDKGEHLIEQMITHNQTRPKLDAFIIPVLCEIVLNYLI